MTIALPDVEQTVTRWPWLRSAVLAATFAVFLGLLSFAGVSEATIDCRDEPIYLTTADGKQRIALVKGTGYLRAVGTQRECDLVFRDLKVAIPGLLAKWL